LFRWCRRCDFLSSCFFQVHVSPFTESPPPCTTAELFDPLWRAKK
jgi:hypothetical protein